MNKKAQVQSIIYFFGIVVAVFIVGIFVLKLIQEPLTKFSGAMGNISASAGKTSIDITNSAVRTWDYVLLALFMLNVIMLFVTAFLIDVHPAFMFIYIIAVFMLVVLGSPVLNAMDKVWSADQFSEQAGAMPITNFIVDNFMLVMLGVIVLSGIIMYAKMKYFSGSGTGGNY